MNWIYDNKNNLWVFKKDPNKLRYSNSPDKYMYDLTYMFSLENAYNAYKLSQPKEPNL